MRLRRSVWLLLVVAAMPLLGCSSIGGHNIPPAARLMEPGPGVGGPGPGVMLHGPPAPAPGSPMLPGPGMGVPAMSSTQVWFAKPSGMQVRAMAAENVFEDVPMVLPARRAFTQGGLYRMKITNIPGREGVELYPTLEIGPATARSAAFLAHSAVPIQFSEEDFDQVLTGNFVTKVIYLPDPDFQDFAQANIAELVSTRLDPGVDPIVEADRQGSILAILRLGNKDVALDGSAGMAGVPLMGGQAGIAGAGPAFPPGYVAGVTSPNYGMPITGTPIGLPGPPHIPLGGPAGLRQHVMKNNTAMHIPDPVSRLKYNVKQTPGLSYPRPVRHVRVHEKNSYQGPNYVQPGADKYECVD